MYLCVFIINDTNVQLYNCIVTKQYSVLLICFYWRDIGLFSIKVMVFHWLLRSLLLSSTDS